MKTFYLNQSWQQDIREFISLRGQFLAGQFSGQGYYTWRDGRTYKGQYEGGKRHGKVIIILLNLYCFTYNGVLNIYLSK